jgi:hypothetical protein
MPYVVQVLSYVIQSEVYQNKIKISITADSNRT